MKRLLALAALAFATPAHADGFKNREIAFQVLNAADLIQTCHFISTGRGVEGNPIITSIMGETPSCRSLAAFKAGGGILHYLIAKELNKRDPEAAKWFQTVSIGVQGTVVAANFRLIF
mgnify:CR=1 FL=1